MAAANIPGFGRFSGPAVLVLVSLAAGPRHGYAIQTDIEEVTGTRLGPGTLYGAISRLEERGLIEALPVDDRRRPYRVSAAGVAALHGQLDAMHAVVAAGRRRLAVT